MNNRSIDKSDAEILKSLMMDARVDLKELSAECGLTPSAVLKRIKKLKDCGIIVGTRLELRQGVLGYPQEATVGITADTSQIDEVARKVRSIPNVIVCAKSMGRYNLFAHLFTKDLQELDKVVYSIKNIVGIRAITTNIHVEECLHKNDASEKQAIGDKTKKPDATDLKIIDALAEDSQMPFKEVGRRLGISHETVRQRYERMFRDGILRCSIVVDRSRIGYQGTAFYLIGCSERDSVELTLRALRGMQVFNKIDKVFGGAFDIMAIAPVKDLRDLGKLTDIIQKIPTVQNVETCILVFTYYSFLPRPRSSYKCDNIELC